MSKHTLEPWELTTREGKLSTDLDGSESICIVKSKGSITEYIAHMVVTGHYAKKLANARLIAAAPDLLEFIEQWEGHHLNCDYLDEGSPRTDCTCGYDKTRDEAIAKATD